MCTTDGSANLWQFEALDGPTLTNIAEKARQRHITVVCPLLTLEDENRYNSSVLIGREVLRQADTMIEECRRFIHGESLRYAVTLEMLKRMA